jgi:hypothetical protein
MPGGGDQATRWTVRAADVPAGMEALLIVTIEEMAINELRETFHHWVHTVRLPVRRGVLGEPLPHVPARRLRVEDTGNASGLLPKGREIWADVAPDLRRVIDAWRQDLERRLGATLEQEREAADQEERSRFQSRQGEVSALIEQTTVARLEREIARLERELAQGELFDQERRIEAIARSQAEMEEEVRRRRSHYEELRDQLAKERDRVLNLIIPRRFALHTAQVFPVAVEIRLPPTGAPP